MNKPLFHFLANTMRVRIIPHYKHFLKDPLWPRFLTHSTVLLIDSWPQTRWKSRTFFHVPRGPFLFWRLLSLLEQAWQLSHSSQSLQGPCFPGDLFSPKLEPTRGSLWPLSSFVVKGQRLDDQAPSRVPFSRLFLLHDGAATPLTWADCRVKWLTWFSSRLSCIFKFRPGQVPGKPPSREGC